MISNKKVLPGWMRSVMKVGVVLYGLLLLGTLVTHNWLQAVFFALFGALCVTMILTTRSKP